LIQGLKDRPEVGLRMGITHGQDQVANVCTDVDDDPSSSLYACIFRKI